MTGTAARAVEGARAEAIQQGARTIEAEHLLLALTHEPDCATVLREAGLDEAALRRALHDEWESTLRAAGVTQEIPAPGTPDRGATPRAGESLKLALKRGHIASKEHRSRRLRGVDLLYGVVAAERGTVPHALHATDLREHAERAL